MELQRNASSYLDQWKNSNRRKPLLIRGARQVGKSFLIQQFSKQFESYVEINLDLLLDAERLFETDLEPQNILSRIYALTGQDVIPGKTLLFLDEIQEVPRSIKALRYFYEKLPELHVIAAGSLIEFQLETMGFPVGRLQTLYLYPLSFVEFLEACGYGRLVEYAKNCDTKQTIDPVIHGKLLELLGEYFAVGGMPEAVFEWVQSKNLKEVHAIHQELVATYRQDFPKYAKQHEIKYVEKLFMEVPRLLCQNFHYGQFSGEFRKRDLQPALELLIKAGMVHEIQHTAANGVPLGAEVQFQYRKLAFIDIAMAQSILGHSSGSWLVSPSQQFVNQGALTESFVAQELLAYAPANHASSLYYWQRLEKSSKAEIDFVIEVANEVIPIEVKSGKTGRLRSLHEFLRHHPQSPYGIQVYPGQPQEQSNIHSYPLYAVASLRAHFNGVLDTGTYFF